MSIIVETNSFGNFESSKPRATIIPVSFECSKKPKKGTRNGAQAILNASLHLSPFDDEVMADISKLGINTYNFIDLSATEAESKEPFRLIEKAVKFSIIDGSIPFLIGGEGAISYAAVKSLYDLYPDISVIHFSSRTKLNIAAENKFDSRNSMGLLFESMPDVNIVNIGVRSTTEKEIVFAEENNLDLYYAGDKKNWDLSEILSKLTKNVYISFDCSVLDSSMVPSVSYPEPNGLSFNECLNILKNICAYKEVLGIDFVEFSPIENLVAADITIAKLIYKTIGYTFAEDLGLFDEQEDAAEDESEDETILINDL